MLTRNPIPRVKDQHFREEEFSYRIKNFILRVMCKREKQIRVLGIRISDSPPQVLDLENKYFQLKIHLYLYTKKNTLESEKVHKYLKNK